jgi:hypothetical protein
MGACECVNGAGTGGGGGNGLATPRGLFFLGIAD